MGRSPEVEDKPKFDAEEYYNKQRDLEKLVESLNDKIQKLETACGRKRIYHIFSTEFIRFIWKPDNLLAV